MGIVLSCLRDGKVTVVLSCLWGREEGKINLLVFMIARSTLEVDEFERG